MKNFWLLKGFETDLDRYINCSYLKLEYEYYRHRLVSRLHLCGPMIVSDMLFVPIATANKNNGAVIPNHSDADYREARAAWSDRQFTKHKNLMTLENVWGVIHGMWD